MSDLVMVFRFSIFACMFGMVMLAVLFLRQRKLSTLGYLMWGLLALFIPILGPYLVIAARPGEANRRD